MKIVTYYEPIHELNPREQSEKLKKWSEEWKAAGFEVQQVGGNDFRRSRHRITAQSLFRNTKTPRNADLELACFYRWFAYDVVSNHIMSPEPVLFSDFDCLPNGFTPEDVLRDEIVFYERGSIPCLVSTASNGLQKLQQFLIRTPDPMEDSFVSDMILFQHNRLQFKTVDCVRDRNEPNFEKAKVIHG
jgi:hypothetical protein